MAAGQAGGMPEGNRAAAAAAEGRQTWLREAWSVQKSLDSKLQSSFRRLAVSKRKVDGEAAESGGAATRRACKPRRGLQFAL
jgi:hypothetical protein